MVELRISSKHKSSLEVWMTKKEKSVILNIKCRKGLGSTRTLGTSHLDGPNSGKLRLTYGVGGDDRRQNDIEKLQKLNNVNVKGPFYSFEDSPAMFLDIQFPEGTKIAVTDYDYP